VAEQRRAWPQLRDLATNVDTEELVVRERDDEWHLLCPCHGHRERTPDPDYAQRRTEQLVRTSFAILYILTYLFLVSNYYYTRI
jgi:hypothetical protein